MNDSQLETALWIFCIVVVSIMMGKIYFDGKTVDCDKCTINFINKLPGGQPYDAGEFKIKSLFEAYASGECPVSWDPNQGYMINGNVK